MELWNNDPRLKKRLNMFGLALEVNAQLGTMKKNGPSCFSNAFNSGK